MSLFLFDVIKGIALESFILFSEMAPYLVLGFLFAGLLNEFISTEKIARHLGRGNLSSVIKAAVFGIPLPLCSCGVIPPTMTLRRNGASRGSVMSFLIATPTSGVDSILATYSLLGPLFAAYRVAAGFAAAVLTGVAANLFDKKGESGSSRQAVPAHDGAVRKSALKRLQDVAHYAFVELLAEIGKWLVIGIVIGGAITYAIPDRFFSETVQSGLGAILIMMAIGIPIYVCATGSIPIAAALMLKGINPGAAFVFLLTGPATNAVTLTVISRYLGKRSILIYLVVLMLSSVGLGLALDLLWTRFDFVENLHHMGHKLLPVWIESASAVLLVLLMLYRPVRKWINKSESREEVQMAATSEYRVPDMSCSNCALAIRRALEQVEGVQRVEVDLSGKRVAIRHPDHVDRGRLAGAIRSAGYRVEQEETNS